MTTAYFTHPDCRGHDMGAGHPECPERLDVIADRLRASGLDAVLSFHDAPWAEAVQIERAHSALYVAEIDAVMRAAEASGDSRAVDPDTAVSPKTRAAAWRAAGAAVAATDEVIAGRAANAFCAVRPPGHHATRDEAMGFCFFNNVAVAARHALDVHGLERVAIVDFDVHHGNGTEDIVAGDPRILMVSFFQHPLYPYSGTEPRGTNMVNVPLPPYTRGAKMREAVAAKWLPALAAFRPQMIFVSAGFDAHREDGLGQMALDDADYAWLTEQIAAVADEHAQGRIVSCLEGGYSLSAMPRAVLAHLRVLAGAHAGVSG